MNPGTQLQHDVLAQLEWEPSVDASQIGVIAKDHVVQSRSNRGVSPMRLLTTVPHPSMANNDGYSGPNIETTDAMVGRSKVRSQNSRDTEIAEMVHDFRNILSTISMLSEVALMELPETSAACPTVRHIRAACADANDLCNRMLDEYRNLPKGIEWINLSALIRAMEPLLTRYVPARSRLSFDLAGDRPVANASACEIRQVVMNLVKNAAEALGDRPGTVTVCSGVVELTSREVAEGVSWCERTEGRYSYIVVGDTGCGMDAAAKARLLTRSFTTKTDGHGLGMASIRRIVQRCSGILQVQSQLECGTQIRILFPQDDQSVSTWK